MDNCTIDCIQIIGNFSRDDTCAFVQDNCQQDTIQVIQAYYCGLGQSFILLVILSIIAMLFIFNAIEYLTEAFLTPCVEQFIHKWRISDAMAGVTFLAFANGAPDVLTAIVAGSSSSAQTALIPYGSLYGAALFCMGVVLSRIIGVLPGQQLSLRKRQVLLPLGLYILGSFYLVITSLVYGKMNLVIASGFLVLYIIYIVVMVMDERKNRQKPLQQTMLDQQSASQSNQSNINQQQPLQNKKDEPQQQQQGVIGKAMGYVNVVWRWVFRYTVPPYSPQSWTPFTAITSLVTAPFVCGLSYGIQQSIDNTVFDIPMLVWFAIPALCFLVHSIVCMVGGRKPQQTILYSIYCFAVVVCWITLICGCLINLLQLLQLLTNINSVFLGLTVLAWANSTGDLFSIVSFAKRGYASGAVAGIFSGQLFNFLLGFGISLFINSLKGQYQYAPFDFQGSSFDKMSDAIIVAVIGMSLIYMCWAVYQTIVRKGLLGAYHGKFALVFYMVFLVAALGLSVGTDFLREISCDIDV